MGLLFWYCTLIILAVERLAERSGKLPYVPIEISRMAADGGKDASLVFQLGFLLGPPLLALLGLVPRLTYTLFASWLGLQLVTF